MGKSTHNVLESILAISFLTIALGATAIESAGRSPNDVFSRIMEQRKGKRILKTSLLPSGGSLYQSRLNNLNIFRIETVKQGCDILVARC
jgi:hypothetical protein